MEWVLATANTLLLILFDPCCCLQQAAYQLSIAVLKYHDQGNS